EGLGASSGTNGGSSYVLSDIDLDGRHELVVYVTYNATGSVVYAFDFGDGFEGDAMQWTTDTMGYIGRSHMAAADVLGDQRSEVLISNASTLHVFDAVTGAAISSTSQWYGDLAAVPHGMPIRGTAADTDSAAELFAAYTFSSTVAMIGIWDIAADGAVTEKWRDTPMPPIRSGPVVDLDGDGMTGVVYASRHDGKWQTIVRRGHDGAVMGQFVDAVPAGAGDLDGAPGDELVLSVQTQSSVATMSALRVIGLVDGVLADRLDAPIADAALAAVIDQDGDGLAELLTYRDTDADGSADALHLFNLAGDQAQLYAAWPFPKGGSVTLMRVRDALIGQGVGQLLLYSSDGYYDVLSGNLTPVSARLATGDFLGGGILTAQLSAGRVALVEDSAGRTLRISLEDQSLLGGTAPVVVFQGSPVRRLRGLPDLDGDGIREALVLETGPSGSDLVLLESDLVTERWRTDISGMTGSHGEATGGDLNGDGILDVYAKAFVGGKVIGTPINGKDGSELGWTYQPWQGKSGAGFSFGAALTRDVDGDGRDDVIVSHSGDFLDGSAGTGPAASNRVLSGLDGELLGYQGSPGPPLHLIHTGATGQQPAVLAAWFNGQLALSPMLDALPVAWSSDKTGPEAYAAPMAPDVDGDLFPDLIHIDEDSGDLHARNGLTGQRLWPGDIVFEAGRRRLAKGRVWRPLLAGGYQDADGAEVVQDLPLTALNPAGAAVTNLTGTGKPTLLLGGRDGWVYAVNGTDGTLHWSYFVGAPVGTVVATDTDGDGLVEVLLSAGDGFLHALTMVADVGQVTQVRDGTGADVDAVGSAVAGIDATGFSVNWDAAVGGSEPVAGYLVRLLTDTGAVVMGWQDVKLPPGNAASFEGFVALTPGVGYRVAVMPYGLQSGGSVALSDGFYFADEDGDGLLDDDEASLGTDPTKPDSDGDGLTDGVETDYGSPVDTDQDGVIDALDSDSDDDGLSDATEGSADTDIDGIPDWRDPDDDNDGITTAAEVQDAAEHGDDPDQDGVPSWHDGDSDADNLLDAEEGTADIDGDGIPSYLDPDELPPEEVIPGQDQHPSSPSARAVRFSIDGGKTNRIVGCNTATSPGPAGSHWAAWILLCFMMGIGRLRRAAASIG
ncbi:MAG: hypothetical protein ACI9WU_002533, partial [Myxococcota bacterium]